VSTRQLLFLLQSKDYEDRHTAWYFLGVGAVIIVCFLVMIGTLLYDFHVHLHLSWQALKVGMFYAGWGVLAQPLMRWGYKRLGIERKTYKYIFNVIMALSVGAMIGLFMK